MSDRRFRSFQVIPLTLQAAHDSEQQLAEEHLSSQHAEYERSIRPIEAQMIRSVWRITLNANDAEDAFQEATSTIWTKMDLIRQHSNPRALILRICIDAAFDVVRKRTRRTAREQPLDLCDGPSGDDIDLLEALESQERQIEITNAISRLPESQAIAVTMHYLMNCPYRDIVDALDCTESTARVHASRGLERLRSLLAHLAPNPSKEN